MLGPLDEGWDEEAGVDLTPLIDVVFLLLVFFILAGTFVRPGLEVNLPVAQSSVTPEKDRQWIIVSIDAKGCYQADGREQTLSGLLELMKCYPEKSLNFHVDRNAPFESFVKVVDQIKADGRDDFIITTKVEDDVS